MLVLLVGLLWSAQQPVWATPRWLPSTPALVNTCTEPLLQPLQPSEEMWVALADGERQWYTFRYEGDDLPITIRMTVLPAHSADFKVLTPAQFQRWTQGEPLEAVGAGTEPAQFYQDLYWSGSFVQSGIYYVLVESNGHGLSTYQLTLRGEQIVFPLPRFPIIGQAESCTTEPLAATLLPPSPLPTPAPAASISSPESPLPPIGKPMTIAAGELHWYAFRDEGDESTIQIRADATPDLCLTFQVWTPTELHQWQQGMEVRPVGQGTANATLKADLFWTGSFVKSGTYYVVVRRNPAHAGPCTYTLTVTGNDVSFVLPPTP
ncbi:MAG: hypothetical protein KF832_29345 [Caldilineaceae bacterium]|nr:hypothetical protein [Caldilineaceae bacterium]